MDLAARERSIFSRNAPSKGLREARKGLGRHQSTVLQTVTPSLLLPLPPTPGAESRGRALDCGSPFRGINSRHSPQCADPGSIPGASSCVRA